MMILNKKFDNSHEEVSLGFNPGVYIVNLKSGQFNHVKKVIIQ
jgi:hypothetical protein